MSLDLAVRCSRCAKLFALDPAYGVPDKVYCYACRDAINCTIRRNLMAEIGRSSGSVRIVNGERVGASHE